MTQSFQQAWVLRVPLKPGRVDLLQCNRRRCSLYKPPRASGSSQTELSLSVDQKAIAQAAVKVTHIIFKDPSSLTTLDLLAFCNVKSLPLPYNIWNRTELENTTRKYLDNELLARNVSGPEWQALPEKSKIKLLHDVCNGEGDVTYVDPATGYTVFSFFAHLKRGNCCGIKEKDGGKERTHRCRHCPYKDDGTLGDRMLAQKERVPLVEFVRKRLNESWEFSDGLQVQSESSDSTASRTPTRSGPAEAELRKKFARKVQIEKKVGDWNCNACSDEQIVTCTRCSGWTYLFSPELMKCPQCSEKGYHPCMNCTSFRPPQRTSFYS